MEVKVNYNEQIHYNYQIEYTTHNNDRRPVLFVLFVVLLFVDDCCWSLSE
jgi:hypothetical protein